MTCLRHPGAEVVWNEIQARDTHWASSMKRTADVTRGVGVERTKRPKNWVWGTGC